MLLRYSTEIPLPSKVIHVRDQLGVEGGGRGNITPWSYQLYSVLVLEMSKRERVRQGKRGEGRGGEGRGGEGRGGEGRGGEGRGGEGRGRGGGYQDTLEFLQEGSHISTLLQPLKGRERVEGEKEREEREEMGTFFITSSQPRRMILSFQSHSSLQDGEGEGGGEGGRGGRGEGGLQC